MQLSRPFWYRLLAPGHPQSSYTVVEPRGAMTDGESGGFVADNEEDGLTPDSHQGLAMSRAQQAAPYTLATPIYDSYINTVAPAAASATTLAAASHMDIAMGEDESSEYAPCCATHKSSDQHPCFCDCCLDSGRSLESSTYEDRSRSLDTTGVEKYRILSDVDENISMAKLARAGSNALGENERVIKPLPARARRNHPGYSIGRQPGPRRVLGDLAITAERDALPGGSETSARLHTAPGVTTFTVGGSPDHAVTRWPLSSTVARNLPEAPRSHIDFRPRNRGATIASHKRASESVECAVPRWPLPPAVASTSMVAPRSLFTHIDFWPRTRAEATASLETPAQPSSCYSQHDEDVSDPE